VSNDVAERYRDKLERHMKQQGVSTLEELRAKYQADINKVKTANKVQPPTAVETGATTPPVPSIPKIPAEKAFKTLSSYIDVDALSKHSNRKEIELIWRARHVNDSSSLCAVLDRAVLDNIKRTARKYPLFVLPLPRDRSQLDDADGVGTEMHLLQWSFPEEDTVHCIITSLLEYKTHVEFARPHTTIIFHAELADSHDIALMNGTVDPDLNVSVVDAHILVHGLQKFYNIDATTSADVNVNAARRLRMLEDFNRGIGFDVNAIIQETERVD
ncbi:ATP11 protein-domain-containing protein, partial [Lipomyces japonicus]|uniref:ATP11 protein-domain-containing protein n=1 Tax=Lipomyces japonicus TaxID=56871 RepID=UPI0034CFD627